MEAKLLNCPRKTNRYQTCLRSQYSGKSNWYSEEFLIPLLPHCRTLNQKKVEWEMVVGTFPSQLSLRLPPGPLCCSTAPMSRAPHKPRQVMLAVHSGYALFHTAHVHIERHLQNQYWRSVKLQAADQVYLVQKYQLFTHRMRLGFKSPALYMWSNSVTHYTLMVPNICSLATYQVHL